MLRIRPVKFLYSCYVLTLVNMYWIKVSIHYTPTSEYGSDPAENRIRIHNSVSFNNV